jgi:hypothetical protein
MVSEIKDDEFLRVAESQMKKLAYDNIHKSRNSITSRPNGGTTFLGERSERRRAERRHKSAYEKYHCMLIFNIIWVHVLLTNYDCSLCYWVHIMY